MADKMMADNEIIKALECFKSEDCLGEQCPYYGITGGCGRRMCSDVYDFINRQKAEIERLNLLQEQHTFYDSNNDDYYDNLVSEAKSEAIKEFAERLKRNHITKDDKGKLHLLIEYDEFENLVKEMTE